MKSPKIRIVLVCTSHPGNIGSAARAMKTMGLSQLFLVNPKSFPDPRAFELAAGADDVLEQAIVTSSLREALEGCELVLGTSARPRDIELPGLTPAGSASLIQSLSEEVTTAIVFGREHAGLTNDELLHCHYHIYIPSNPDYSSLNLAQAVQIIAYEIRMKLLDAGVETASIKQEALATADEIEQFYDHLQAILIAIDFLKLSNPKKLMQRLRRLFNRVRLEKKEINILRGILTHIHYGINQKNKGKE